MKWVAVVHQDECLLCLAIGFVMGECRGGEQCSVGVWSCFVWWCKVVVLEDCEVSVATSPSS